MTLVNLELPAQPHLLNFCPHKTQKRLLKPMSFIHRLRVPGEGNCWEAKNAGTVFVGKYKRIVIPAQMKRRTTNQDSPGAQLSR